jgi:Dihydrouridine synthase (Dus)
MPDVHEDSMNSMSLSTRKYELIQDHDLFVRVEPTQQREKNKKMKDRKKKKLAQQHNPQKLSGWPSTSGNFESSTHSQASALDDIVSPRSVPIEVNLETATHGFESWISDDATAAMEVERKELRAVHTPRPTITFDHRFIVAPMVNQSDPPFRTLCLKYGASCAFTEMLYSKRIVQSKDYIGKRLQVADHTFFMQSSSPADKGPDEKINDTNSASNDLEPLENHSTSRLCVSGMKNTNIETVRTNTMQNMETVPTNRMQNMEPVPTNRMQNMEPVPTNRIQNTETVPAPFYSSRPLIVQICGNDPATLSQCMLKIVQQSRVCPIDAIDFNLGCPQDRAREGRGETVSRSVDSPLHHIS